MTYPSPPPYPSQPSEQSAARAHLRRATELMNSLQDVPPTTATLLYAALAQAEAAVETADLLKGGISLRHAEELTNALNHLARRLPER
jgi:hypothetical protein